jgi:penicillin-binding protein 1C
VTERAWLLRRLLTGAVALALCAGAWLFVETRGALQPVPGSLLPAEDSPTQFLDRNGEPLNATYQGDWNVHDIAPLHEIPTLLQDAFIHAEDKRFYRHGGPDWVARIAALWANLSNGRAIRGASTISEQAVRMLHPRPRTVWTRWIEGFEAARLERRFGKRRILEFYLNQVPYAANRRGVVQAANYYFARDLSTLSPREMLMLAVLVRSPSRLDPYRSVDASGPAIERLTALMVARDALSSADRDAISSEQFSLKEPQLPVTALHFLAHVRESLEPVETDRSKIVTTLDAGTQRSVQDLLDERIETLRGRSVEHGAVLVADVATREILAWAVAGGADEGGPRSHIDAVTAPRQPGSALKPFLYALALDSGWSAAEVIDDAPLAEPVGGGVHRYTNYSERFYGPLTLRYALGNSLNIPAVKTLQHVGVGRYLETLRASGFTSLEGHPDFYGDGLALGNGEVTLLELVQGYAALANAGVFRRLRVLLNDDTATAEARIFSAEAASLVGNILSDPSARALEFGRSSVLNLPVPTAVKTGTSSDFRDAWAVGFNRRYVVGVWMGNLDQRPTQGLTGSTGPALLLRSIFSSLMRTRDAGPLYLSPGLTQRRICVPLPSVADGDCFERDEWFFADAAEHAGRASPSAASISIRQPVPGLLLALDPRLPRAAQAYEFRLDGISPGDEVRVRVGTDSYVASHGRFLWPLSPGQHEVSASVWRHGAPVASVAPFSFTVR